MADRPPLQLDVSPPYREQLVKQLREQILTGELRPGSLLTPTTLAQRLHTSAMPVREALRVLEQEGLVEVSARRYTRVASPRRAVADEAYPLLGLLESHSLQHMPVTRSAIREARRANAALAKARDTIERRRADVRFHRAITASAPPITRGVLSMLYGRIALLEVGYHQTYEPAESVAEHDDLLAALEVGDVEAAAVTVERHWARGYAAILPLLDTDEPQPELDGRVPQDGDVQGGANRPSVPKQDADGASAKALSSRTNSRLGRKRAR